MIYSIEPRNRVLVKGYGFLSFAKSIGKNLTGKYRQRLLHIAEKSAVTKVATDTLKTTWKRAFQKTVCNKILVRIKIADKISNTSSQNGPETNSIKSLNTAIQTRCNTKWNIHITWKKTRNCWWAQINIEYSRMEYKKIVNL